MSTDDFIISLFVRVDSAMIAVPKHPQSQLYPSEVVTLALLFARKGGGPPACYRWINNNYRAWFPGLPDHTRLFRLFATHADWGEYFLAQPTPLGIADTYGIELIHPWRYGRSPRQVGKKGFSNHRWIVGLKLGWLINCRGEVVAWGWNTANRPDQDFAAVAAPFAGLTITLADEGFRQAKPRPENLKLCPRGTWNERMLIETVLSLVHRVCHLKYLWHRTWPYLQMHLAYVAGVFNALLLLNHQLGSDDLWPHIAQYAL